jgi:hypothetical protein
VTLARTFEDLVLDIDDIELYSYGIESDLLLEELLLEYHC